jgi:hypothetical protein
MERPNEAFCLPLYRFIEIDKFPPPGLNAAASALSIMIKSLSCRFNPNTEKFAAPGGVL